LDKITRPFKVSRTISWGDCDPAGIIYTPRVFDMASEALEEWYRDILGVNWYDLNWKLHMGAPTVRIECDFVKSLTPDLPVEFEVRATKLGRSSLTWAITCRDLDGEVYLRFNYITAFISRTDFKSTPIPDNFRRRLEEYRAACGDS
jgi:4-hydroxybenzoyl-CoA thioesterase